MSAPLSRATILLLALLLLGATSTPALCADFDDVPKWHWAWEYVQGVADADVSAGYDDGYWRPSLNVSRDQMAVFITRALCGGDAYVPDGPSTATFADVPKTGYGEGGADPFWAYKYIEYAVAEDITTGYDDNLYHPDWDVTRGQMAAFIARAMCGGEAYVPTPTGDPRFPDVTDTTNDWCYPHVEYIADEEVTLGYPDGLYHPEVTCSRDQMAAYLCRAFSLPIPDSPYDITDRFPLGGYDEWIYEDTDGVFRKTVSGLEELHGEFYAPMISDDGPVEYWLPKPEGLYLGGLYESGEGTISFNPALLIPNGLEFGDFGSQTTTVYLDGETELGIGTFEWEFVTAETVTVPAGTFEDCMKLHIMLDIDGSPDEFDIWAARDVGIVKLDTGSFGGDHWEILIGASIGAESYPDNLGPFTVVDYYPINVGNTWVYDSADGDSINQIVGVEAIGDISTARMAEGPATGEATAQYFTAVDGALCYVGEYDGDTGQMLTLSSPIAFPTTASIGETGIETAQAYLDGTPVGAITFEWTIVGWGPVTVDAGTFNDCVKMRIAITDPSEQSEVYTWLALGVGPVKEDERPFDGTWWSELKSADIGSLHYPQTGMLFEIEDYADFTVGNVRQWDDSGSVTISGIHDEGGHTWAELQDEGGVVNYWRKSEDGVFWLGWNDAGDNVRFDPPLSIASDQEIGDIGAGVFDVTENGSPAGGGSYEYTLAAVEPASVQAGLFRDCMNIELTLASPVTPTCTVNTWWARNVGPVKIQGDDGTTAEVTAAQVNELEYPPDEAVYDVTDYFPLAIGDIRSTIRQGEGSYGAEHILVPSTEDLSGLGVTDTVYRVIGYSGNAADEADFWANLPEGVARYGHWEPGTTIAANPPLVTPNGISIGDSGSDTTPLYVWDVDHWESAGTASAEWQLFSAGPISTAAGYFPDCILLRWQITIPGDDLYVQYVWLAKGIGPVMEYELGDFEWTEITGATIDGITFPPDPAAAVVETATITQGASLGFDFSADGMAALPDDQDLSYVYTAATDAVIESFDTNGVSPYIGYGEWDFLSLHTYSTFMPPNWDIWGQAWWSSASVLASTWDAVDSTVVVRTREGRYALVHITDATPAGLNIEYVYPYGAFVDD